MRSKWISRALAATLLSIGCASARAVPVDYSFTLLVESVQGIPNFDLQPGQSYSGLFQVAADTAALADGIYSFIPLNSWSIAVGPTEWDMNRPWISSSEGSDFRGFRDGAFCGASGSGQGGINPGLRVSSGAVTGFCGGVFGIGDVPFIDFDFLNGPGRYNSVIGSYGFAGSYRIDRSAVPEPASAALWLLSIVLLGAGCALRERRVRHPQVPILKIQ